MKPRLGCDLAQRLCPELEVTCRWQEGPSPEWGRRVVKYTLNKLFMWILAPDSVSPPEACPSIATWSHRTLKPT